MQSIRQIILGLGLLAAANLAQAALITLDGDHFSVTYDDAQVGLYNQGQLSGSLDTVYFLPTTFVAVSGGAPVTTKSALQFTLNIDPGYVFAGLGFAENGNYILSGGGSVSAEASVQAVNLDTFASDVLLLDSGALSQIGATTGWAISGGLGTQALGAAQNLQISLDNALASEPVRGIGLIRKTYVGFRVQTREVQAVPEPSGIALMVAGLLAALAVGSRRRMLSKVMAS